jgi:predicted nucleic acid-binding protein
MIIDASVILSALFPDEAQSQAQAVLQAHVVGKISLLAPTLLPYELTNAVWQGVRRGRITIAQAEAILQAVDGLNLPVESVSWQSMFTWAQKYNRSAYDAAYLSLAHSQGRPLVTGDLRLYNAVHSDLAWVIWIGDYQT